MIKVIYLSFAQGQNIDGPLLAQSIAAVMVRAGQGIWEDPLFRYNYNICVTNKIPFGIWWFCQPDMRAAYQVDAFMKVWDSLPFKPVVIAYDVEEIDYKDDNGQMQKLFPPSRQFNHDNVLAWCKQVKAATGAHVGIYTRKNYFEAWTFETQEWYQYWMWIAAWYLYTGEVPPALPWGWTEYKIHQYEGGSITGTPGVDPAPTCKEYFNGMLEECLEFFGAEEQSTMTGIYNTVVPIANRGHFVWFSSDDKQIDIQSVNTQTEAIFLRCVTQETGNMTVLSDPAFQTWVDRASVPVAVIGIDQNLAWNKEITLPKWQARTMWENETFKAFINQWRSVPIPQSEWDAEKLNITAVAGWHKINAIVLHMTSYLTKGSVVNGMWQTAMVDDLLKPLTSLMQGGYIPTVKIYVAASSDWWEMYRTDTTWELSKRIQSGQVAGAGMLRVWGKSTLGLIEEAPMSSPAPTLAELWQYGVDENYTYPVKLDGIEFQFFLYSWNRIRATNVFYKDAIVTPTACGLWCDTAAAMLETLGVAPEEPPVVPGDLEIRLAAVEVLLQSILQRLDALEGNLIQWPQMGQTFDGTFTVK